MVRYVCCVYTRLPRRPLGLLAITGKMDCRVALAMTGRKWIGSSLRYVRNDREKRIEFASLVLSEKNLKSKPAILNSEF